METIVKPLENLKKSESLKKSGNDVKTAIVMILLNIDKDMAAEKLNQCDENVAKIIHENLK